MSDRLPNAIDRHVASRLRLRRLEAGLSQTVLADALGVTFQQLQKYEGATNRISAGALYQLALTLDVPVQYFFDGLSRRDKKRADSYLICGAAGAASRSFSQRKSFAFFNPRELCGREGNHAIEPRATRGVVVFCTCRPLELVPASPYDRALYS
jgi:transcriptional regulator with XRE-family HTH domain